jgi:hypothetical protein
MLEKRLDGTRDVLGVDEFIALPAEHMSEALAGLIFSEVAKSEESSDKESAPVPRTGPIDLQNRFSALHKQVVYVWFLASIVHLVDGLREQDNICFPCSPSFWIYSVNPGLVFEPARLQPSVYVHSGPETLAIYQSLPEHCTLSGPYR